MNIDLWIFVRFKICIKKIINFNNQNNNQKYKEYVIFLEKKEKLINKKIKLILEKKNKIEKKEKKTNNWLFFQSEGTKSLIITTNFAKDYDPFKINSRTEIQWFFLQVFDLEKEINDNFLLANKKKVENKKNENETIEPWIFFQKLIEKLKNNSNVWNNFFINKMIFFYLNSNITNEKNEKSFNKREGYYIFDTAIYKEEVEKYDTEIVRDSLNYQKRKEDQKIFRKIKINLEIILDFLKFNDKYLFKNQKIKDIDKSKYFLEKEIEQIQNKIEMIEKKIKEIKKIYTHKNEKKNNEKWLNFKISGLNEMIKILSKERNIKKKYFVFDPNISLIRRDFIHKKNIEKVESERRLNFELSYRSIKASEELVESTKKEIENNKLILIFTAIMAVGTLISGSLNVFWSSTKKEEIKLLSEIMFYLSFSFFLSFLFILIFYFIKKYIFKRKKEKKIKKYRKK